MVRTRVRKSRTSSSLRSIGTALENDEVRDTYPRTRPLLRVNAYVRTQCIIVTARVQGAIWWIEGTQGMSFYKEYELLDPLPGGTVRSFTARQIATQRDVWVHLLIGGSDAVLRQMDSLPPEKRSLIVDQGQHESTTYVVTSPLPGGMGFEEWLSTPPSTPATPKQDFTRAGRWDIAQFQRPPGNAPEPARAPASAGEGPGEFTRMFESPVAG